MAQRAKCLSISLSLSSSSSLCRAHPPLLAPPVVHRCSGKKSLYSSSSCHLLSPMMKTMMMEQRHRPGHTCGRESARMKNG